ncbi:hypothetical protein [Rhizobium sp.]|uniref:hypothetical protein n=1 Tax=Rhizobium sp. TaxID=391 RepID=UPI002AA65DB8
MAILCILRRRRGALSSVILSFSIDGEMLTARMPPNMRPAVGTELKIGIDPTKLHLFDAITTRAIH